jgi:hypothetical protein
MSGDSKKINAMNYFGGKFSFVDEIYTHFPVGFNHLVDLFAGSFVVSLNYTGRIIKTANEINSEVTNFFSVLRDDTDRLIRAIQLTPCSVEEFNNSWKKADDPCFTLIARMDKKPPYIVSAINGNYGIIVYENDSEEMIEIKRFMAENGLIDIKMRMLKIEELLPIQGFPKNYKLVGTQTQKKKYIGNSVEVQVGISLFKSIDAAIQASRIECVA